MTGEPAFDTGAEGVARAAARLAVEGGAGPASAVAVARLGEGGALDVGAAAAGTLEAGGAAPAATVSTRFDLASVTKPVTALVAARLVRAGVVSWDTPLGAIVPEARGTASEAAPLALLLAHRAGLDGHRPLYAPLLVGDVVDRAEALRCAAAARRADCAGAPPREGFAPVYSDLGYLLAGEALSRAGGAPLDELVAREVTAPLGLAERIGSARTLGPTNDVAATEIVAWRGGTIRGEVHDENAWALGGRAACGHAGLFGDALAVARLGVAVLRAVRDEVPGWLRASDVAELVRERPGGMLRAGFDGKSDRGSSAGTRFGPRSFGHLGFTGTSLWIDPDAALVVAFLTNRVHPTRANDAIRAVRPRVHDLVASWALA